MTKAVNSGQMACCHGDSILSTMHKAPLELLTHFQNTGTNALMISYKSLIFPYVSTYNFSSFLCFCVFNFWIYVIICNGMVHSHMKPDGRLQVQVLKFYLKHPVQPIQKSRQFSKWWTGKSSGDWQTDCWLCNQFFF